jgi:hypothetical protein
MDASEPIAIVGLALRFPGDADNVESFWNILSNRESTLTEIPSDRFNADAFWHPNTDRGGTVSAVSILQYKINTDLLNQLSVNTKKGSFLETEYCLF